MKNLLPSILSVAGVVWLTSCSPKQAPPTAGAPDVVVHTVAVKPVVLTTELPGRTSAYRIAEIRPQVSGVIQKRLFVEGSDVEAGQALYQIDPAPFQAALDNAKAALGRAQANLPAIQTRVERYRQALTEKAVSQQDFEDAEAALKQARADIEYWQATVETARINLGYARVVSPISGRIGKSSVTDGAIVTAYQPVALASIQQLDPIYVDVPQSTTDLLRLQRRLNSGQLIGGTAKAKEVTLVLPDGSRYTETGTLQFRDVSVDPTTASVTLRMVFPNKNSVLLPGMFVRAIIEEGSNPEGILIPQQTVARDPKGNPLALVVKEDSTVEQRTLKLDRAIGDQWLVSSGLTAGERIVLEGIQKVRPGMKVTIVTPPEPGSKSAGTNQPAAAK